MVGGLRLRTVFPLGSSMGPGFMPGCLGPGICAARTHTPTRMRVHTHTHAHAHTYTHTHTHAHTHAHTYTQIAHTYTDLLGTRCGRSTYTHTHTNTHTHIHTHTHTHTQVWAQRANQIRTKNRRRCCVRMRVCE